ncbi:MAG: DUF4070 domain-containing protein [Gemmataceae bacterium]
MSAQRALTAPKIYMIQPKFPPSYWGLEHFMAVTPYDAVFPPLGLLTLAALTPAEFSVELCDENAGEEIDYAVDADLICLTGYIIQMKHVFEVADRFRALGKLVVIGGPMANLIPDECRVHCDILFEGEAEYTWPRFLREFSEGRHAKHYVETEKIHLPDSPAPRLDVLKRKYAHGIVQCTRGCPFTCEFCDIIVMYGRKMRYKPTEQILAEVQAWHDLGVAQVFFADDNFVGNRANTKAMLRALAEWNKKQERPLSFYTQASVDMARDEELLSLLREANFISVFLGIESPRKESLAETMKLQNERIDLVAAIHKIQSYNLFIWAGMIVGFDNDDVSIFEEQYQFLQKAQIPFVMLSVLLAVPKTPLYIRLKAEGRLFPLDTDFGERVHYVGTAGGTNFHPKMMTSEELKEGQAALYRRLYEPAAFAWRVLGNLARFHDINYRAEPPQIQNVKIINNLIRFFTSQGAVARRFFWGCLVRAMRMSPELVPPMVVYLGMYMHFCKVHDFQPSWDLMKIAQDKVHGRFFAELLREASGSDMAILSQLKLMTPQFAGAFTERVVAPAQV